MDLCENMASRSWAPKSCTVQMSHQLQSRLDSFNYQASNVQQLQVHSSGPLPERDDFFQVELIVTCRSIPQQMATQQKNQVTDILLVIHQDRWNR